MKDSARQKIETGLPLTILDKLLTNSYRNVFIINSINVKNPGEIMSYEQNSVMMSSLSFNKRGGTLYINTKHTVNEQLSNRLFISKAICQHSKFWTFSQIKPFLHSVSQVSAIALTLSVVLAVSSLSSLVYANETDATIDFKGLTPPLTESNSYGVDCTTNTNVSGIFKFPDAADHTEATWFFLNGSSTTKSLTIDISGDFPIPNSQNEGIDSVYRFYLAGGLRTISTGNTQNDIPYSWKFVEDTDGISYVESNGTKYYAGILGADGKVSPLFSTSASGYSLVVKLADNASMSTKIHGARNDLYGEGSSLDNEPIGAANKNSVEINFGKDSTLYSQIIFGGRSAQREGVKAYIGSQTNYNEITINGNTLAGTGQNAFKINDPSSLRGEMVMRAGIWGAEGYETNSNFVKVLNATVVAQDTTLSHWGITGGRGFFQNRMNLKPERDGESSISNNNVVLIKNSLIGFNNSYKSWDGSGNTVPQLGGKSINVYGGYSVGTASNNLVVIENTQITGNVYGGFELQNRLKGSTDSIRELNPNLVSLHNVKLAQGHSFYGSATADLYNGTTPTNYKNNSDTKDFQGNDRDYSWLEDDQVVFNESSLFPVNRRRGVAYLAGQVESDSAYVRYIHFGQYYSDQISNASNITVAKSYYPHIAVQASQEYDDSDAGIVRIKDQNNSNGEGISFGQQVAGSFLLNRKGFHSDLSPSSGESDTTLGMHNFWVAAYVNLLGTIDGDGKSLNTKVNLFTDGVVNHNYTNGDLSLLALDDGYVFNKGKQEKPWMQLYRDQYTNNSGRVLYLGVNDGSSGSAVNINFGEIEKFRNQTTGQGTKAFGNTQVGVWVNGRGQDEGNTPYRKSPSDNGDTSYDWEDMVIHVPNFLIKQGSSYSGLATFGIYKYLHLDGTYNDSTETKLTSSGEAGGVGLKYWLESINLTGSLILNGADIHSTTGENIETYTLSAYLTGFGGIEVPANNKVVIGDINQPALARVISGEGGTPQEKIGENTFTGMTRLDKSATLIQNSDGALGSDSLYTSQLFLSAGSDQDKTQYNLNGHKQTVGGLVVQKKALVKFNSADKGGHLVVKGNASVVGNLEDSGNSRITIQEGNAFVSSSNENFLGVFELIRSRGELTNQTALVEAKAIVSSGSSLIFNSADPLVTRDADARSAAYIRAVHSFGEVFLSGGTDEISHLNHVNLAQDYSGELGSVIHYRGLVQGPDNSYVDVVHSSTATGTSKVSFGDDHSKIPVSGIFKEARGEKTLKSEGIPIFVIADKGIEENQLRLEMQPFGVVAKDNEAYKWIYRLGYNDEEQGSQRTWVLYNSDDKGHYEPLVPPKEEENLVLRPEAGAYVGASQSWAKMHMRLHDRFGQAYYIDPFDGEEKPAAAWVRQVGSHSHFRMAGGQSKTHSNTAVTQIGGDLLRNEFNEDWKYIGGVFAGGLYNRSDSRSWDSAKSRSDGYSLGIYGTLYTGNSPDDGFYVDSWLLFGRYDNKIWSDEISPFKFKSHGWVWSVETGYTIPIGESGSKDYNKLIWTFQPEAQLVWDGVKANSANDSFGTKYRQLGTDNVTLRVGARLHANYMNKGLGFIEGNWIHNSKKAGVQMGTDKIYMDGGRNLGEFRMGLEGHLSRNTLGWATVGVQAGKSGYHNETAQIGIKYMF